jgi:Ankyrin repeats (3 copies)
VETGLRRCSWQALLYLQPQAGRSGLEWTFNMSSVSAAFATVSTLTLAHACALQLNSPDQSCISCFASKADVEVLAAAHELCMPYSDGLVYGVASGARLSILRWLHTLRASPLPRYIDRYAATSGCVDTLKWLQVTGIAFTADTVTHAARCRRLPALQFLYEQGCSLQDGGSACEWAATAGDFEVLRWLRNHGGSKDVVTIAAAFGRSATVELMQWLQQRPGIAFSADTMQAAVASGNLHVCQYLQAVGCDANEEGFLRAALSGNVEIVRFLHEHGCPWELRAVLRQSAAVGHVDVLTYLWHSGVQADAVLLTDMLNAAAAGNHLETAQWLRDQGAL